MGSGRTLLLIVGCLVAGAGAYALLSPEPERATQAPNDPTDRLDRIEQSLERLVSVIEKQQERQPVLQSRASSVPSASGSARRPTAGGAGARVPSAKATEIPGSEAGMLKTLEILPDKKLRIQAKKLTKEGEHAAAALHYKALLKRDLSVDDRAEVRLGYGMALKRDGRLEDALEVFQTLADSNVEHMHLGTTGTHQVAHIRLELKDARGALAAAREVAASDAPWMIKAQGRLLVAECLTRMGDKTAAAAELEAMLDEHEDDPKYELITRQIKQKQALLR